MMTIPSLGGKVVLITGGTRGIGRAVAEDFLRQGASVCITGRKQESMEHALEDLRLHGPVLGVVGKTDDAQHRADTVACVLAELGSIDILVNNAATNPQYGPLVEADLSLIRKVLSVNVESVIGWVQEVWKECWSTSRPGSVVNVASVGGLRVRKNVGAYNISKAALIHLTKQFAMEMAPNVRVNGVAPGIIKTDFARALYEGREAEVAARYPLARLGEVEDVVGAVAFLASDAAGWITGRTIEIDGGDLLG